MKNLFKYLNTNGIILINQNKKFPIHSFEKVVIEHLKFQLPKNELNLYLKKFLDEMYKNKFGIEYNGLGNLKSIISRDMFTCLYSLKILKTQKNTPLKKLPKSNYGSLEREIYNFITQQKVTPQKYLNNYFETSSIKGKNEIEKALKKLQKELLIVKIGQDKLLGNLWKPAWAYDMRLTKKILKLQRGEAIKKIIFYLIKSSNGITRPQIKKILKNFVSNEEIDRVVTSLILDNFVVFHKTIVVNGKKALIALK